MAEPVINVEKLSKRYIIGHQRPKGDGFRHVLEAAVRSPRRWLRDMRVRRSAAREEFWALRDVNIAINQGEVVGIIGRNGAGKSTLLKILSRITEPTHGRITIDGRVASLLEVGTGFHPELTGRENIFLNGAILGMSRHEIKSRFDAIVAFAEVEKFLDTPVKRYSSGMYVRLAFAVAAHLEPEILIVDEVLAVGDAAFQKKCLGRMDTAAKEGRTILFVSHNMAAVQSLCSRAVYLRDGQVADDGPVAQTLATYFASAQQLVDGQSLAERRDRVGGNLVRITKVEFLQAETGEPLVSVLSGQEVLIRFHYECLGRQPVENVAFAIAVFTGTGNYLFSCNSDTVGVQFRLEPGPGTCVCRIPKWPLTSGRYLFNVLASRNGAEIDWVKDAGYVDVETGDFYGTSKLPSGGKTGVLIDYQWDDDVSSAPAAHMTGTHYA